MFLMLNSPKLFLLFHVPNPSDSPRNTSVLISPTDPVSVGSVVNLTCFCRSNPPVFQFVWFRISDERLEQINVDTQVYGFNVTDRDRDRSFYCGCRNDVDVQFSVGHRLVFEGNSRCKVLWCCNVFPLSRRWWCCCVTGGQVGVTVVEIILGIVLPVALIITLWWDRCFCTAAD